MSRYFIELQYDGTNYHGWQVQQNANSVQAELNHALSTVLQETIQVTGAGRTDTGVHAKQMFAHFDTEQTIESNQLIFKLNNFLPFDISCSAITPVQADAHTRFTAESRTYEYHITTVKNPFLQHRAYYYPHALNLEKMNAAEEILKSHSDFSCFSKSNTDTHTNDCMVYEACWELHNHQLCFTISANRFLRNMVRAIVGTMLDLGREKISLADFKSIIQSQDRSRAGTSVPAHGLYLVNVSYPKEVLNG